MSNFKNKKGGDPSRRPGKVAVSYPCPGCGTGLEDIVDEGKTPHKLCDSCRDRKDAAHQFFDQNYGHVCTGFGGGPWPEFICNSCGNTRGYMTYFPDPWRVKNLGDYEWVWMHEECRKESSAL